MNEYDNYIQHYLSRHFQYMLADLVPRDFELEQKIILVGKIEYLLQKSVSIGHQGKIIFPENIGLFVISSG